MLLTMSENYFLGIDAGGTRTQAALADSAGNVLARAQAGAGSLRAGAQHVYEVLLAVSEAVKTTKFGEINGKTRLFCAAGIAGYSNVEALNALQAMPFPFAGIRFTSDADIACIGAHAGSDGAVVIAGTGSIGFARRQGMTTRIGGYGFPISDEGSGAQIGLQALQHFLRIRDGCDAPDALAERLVPFVHANPIEWWSHRATAKDFAELAPAVFAALEAGSRAARAIVQRAGEDISSLALALCGEHGRTWCFMGGLAQQLQPFLSAPAERLRVSPKGSAVDGALWLARQTVV